MPSETWVARFVVDHGQVTEEGGRLRTFARRRLDEPEIDLHLLSEPSGPKADEFGSQALDAIGRDFLKDALSLTGGIVRAMRSTNQVLLDWNRRSIAREQVSVGVTAAIVRGSVVYLAQAGPSLAFLRQDGLLHRLTPEEGAVTALGEGAVEPELRRIELAPGDVLMGASANLEAILDFETLANLLERGADVALPELYLRSRELPSFALFAISCLEAVAEEKSDEEAQYAGPEEATQEPRAELPPDPALSFEPESESSEPPSGPVLAMPKPLDISRPVVRLRSDQLSRRGDYPRTTGASGIHFQLPAPRLLGIAAAVGVAVFLAAFTLPGLIRQDRQEAASTLVERALTAYGSFQRETDPTRRRTLLEETRRLASEALRNEPSNVQASELRQQAGAALTAMDNVLDLGPMQTVVTLGRLVTGDVAIERVVAAGGNAYLLDSRGRRIITVPLSAPGPPAVAYEDGQAYGGTTARRPQFMTWDGAGNRLLVLDSERKLFEVRPGSAQPLALRRSAAWQSVAGISSYDGNLYVLDAKAGQVLRYLPAASGFDSEPIDLLNNQAQVANGISLTVQTDLFVLTADGKVKRYRNGNEATLPMAGIDRALSSPASIIAAANSDELYIADSGNKRIVVTDRDGVFRRQLVSSALTDVRAVSIEASAGQVYAVVGDALLMAALVR